MDPTQTLRRLFEATHPQTWLEEAIHPRIRRFSREVTEAQIRTALDGLAAEGVIHKVGQHWSLVVTPSVAPDSADALQALCRSGLWLPDLAPHRITLDVERPTPAPWTEGQTQRLQGEVDSLTDRAKAAPDGRVSLSMGDIQAMLNRARPAQPVQTLPAQVAAAAWLVDNPALVATQLCEALAGADDAPGQVQIGAVDDGPNHLVVDSVLVRLPQHGRAALAFDLRCAWTHQDVQLTLYPG